MLTYIYIQPFQMCLVAAKSMRHGEGRVRATRVSTNMAILQGLRGFSLPQTLTPLQHSSNRATQTNKTPAFVFHQSYLVVSDFHRISPATNNFVPSNSDLPDFWSKIGVAILRVEAQCLIADFNPLKMNKPGTVGLWFLSSLARLRFRKW